MWTEGFEVEILVDGKPAKEYAASVDGDTHTCFIESVEGKEFAVQVTRANTESDWATVAAVYLDGCPRPISNMILEASYKSILLRGKQVSVSELAPFMFKTISTTDEQTMDDVAVAEQLGAIELRLRDGKPRGEKFVPAQLPTEVSNLDKAFNELAIKKSKLSHTCGLGAAAKNIESFTQVNFDYIDYKPHTTFVFKYRSKSLLLADDIMPKTYQTVASPARLWRKREGVDEGDISIITISSTTSDAEETESDSDVVTDEESLAVIDQLITEKAKLEGERRKADDEKRRVQAELSKAKQIAKERKKTLRKTLDSKPTLDQLAAARDKRVAAQQ